MEAIVEKIQHLKRDGKKIVFTNGVFDIIHRGHVAYLNEAKALGDYLIVGLNADASVKRLKGDSRPVNKEQDRKFVMENLKAVDDVIIFTEDTPFNLISKIIPDILVKGGDWKEDQIVGSDIVKQNGGKVFSLKFIDNYSTTGIIEKIIKL
jgi:rfaE bifunctional protein nucleotidyltransferase chain/domain